MIPGLCRLLPALLLLPAAGGHGAERLGLDGEAARWRALALLEALNADLLAADSATLTLESWCGRHGLASPAHVTAQRDREADAPASPAVRAALGVDAGTPLRYRRVRLVCGGHVLSEAENWYVPARLTAPMNTALDGSDTPFGKVVRPLQPSRRTLRMTRDWSPDAVPASPPSCAANAFSHEALVLDGKGEPLAYVIEHYRLELACAAR